MLYILINSMRMCVSLVILPDMVVGLLTAPTLSFPEECQAMKPSIDEAIASLQR